MSQADDDYYRIQGEKKEKKKREEEARLKRKSTTGEYDIDYVERRLERPVTRSSKWQYAKYHPERSSPLGMSTAKLQERERKAAELAARSQNRPKGDDYNINPEALKKRQKEYEELMAKIDKVAPGPNGGRTRRRKRKRSRKQKTRKRKRKRTKKRRKSRRRKRRSARK